MKNKKLKVKDVMGLLAGWDTPTQKLKDEARKGWEAKIHTFK